MKTHCTVKALNQRAIDKISTVLLNAYYKENNCYPNNCEGILIEPNLQNLSGVIGTLIITSSNTISRKFNEDRLLDRSEKIPASGNIT